VLHGPKVKGYSFRLDEMGITHVVTLLNDQSEEKKARVHTYHLHSPPPLTNGDGGRLRW
jgi:hypothetical protein